LRTKLCGRKGGERQNRKRQVQMPVAKNTTIGQFGFQLRANDEEK
jgi:hypothetical protein